MQRNIAVDFVKVIATLLVLNSHMGICYGAYSMLATGGAIGDALFFFISGFTLFLGVSKIGNISFINWYKKRIGRIYPTILATGLVSGLFFANYSNFIEVISAEKYWFLQCILVSYLFLYPILRNSNRLNICILISIILTIILYFTAFDFNGHIFYGVNNYFRWVFYFNFMLIGGWIFINNKNITYKNWHLIAFLICVILWYGINFISKGGNLTILSMIPLIGICYFMYSIGKSLLIEKIFNTKIGGNILFIIGNLCLESYLIQKFIFTDKLNYLFPLNIPIIIIAVLFSAYILRIISKIISQIFDSKPFEWKSLLLYKH